MTLTLRSLQILPAVLAAALSAGTASSKEKAPVAVSIQSGYSFGAGAWQDHRYAGVDQFGNDLVLFADFEVGFGLPSERTDISPSPFETWSAAVLIAYSRLSTSGWEEYVLEQGEVIEASAGIWHIDGALRRRIVTTRDHLLRFEFGGGLALASSEETYHNLAYDYDFLQRTRAEFLLGLIYDWKFSRAAGLCVRAGFMWAGNGLKYADGEKMGIFAFPLTAGIRFYL